MREVYILNVWNESGDDHPAERVFSGRVSNEKLLEIVATAHPHDFINQETGLDFKPGVDDIHSDNWTHYAYFELIGPKIVEEI